MKDDALPATWTPRPVGEVFMALRPADRAPSEAARFAAEMPGVLARFEESDPTRARTELGHLTTLMRSSEQNAAKLAERGFFRRMWSRLTGEEPQNAAEVRARLGEVQTRALAVTERLLTREAFLAHAAHHLGGRLELLAVENVKLKGALVALGERVVDRVERLESRLARMERRSDGLERRIALTELFQSGFSPSEHRPYYEIDDPLERALTVARDFAEAAGGDWRPIDLHRLQTLAQVDAQLADMDPLLMHEWIERALAIADRRGVVDWLRHGALGEKLMAPLDDETREARSFYPIHFLLQRPAWFVEQGLPRSAATGVITDELRAYGLDMSEALTPWRLVQLLLEERMAWTLEAPTQTEALPGPAAVAGPALVGRTLPTGGRIPDMLWMVGGDPVMRALDEGYGRPVLLEWVSGVPRPIQPQPPIGELPVARHRYSVWDGVIHIVAAETGRVVAGRRTGAPGEPWDWETWPAATPGAPVGVAAGPDRLLVWDRAVVIERSGDDRRNVPRPVIDAAVGADAGWLLLRDHVQRWPKGGEPLEWAAFPRGLKGVALAVSSSSMARPVALCRDPERQAVLVAAGQRGTATLPVADDAGFAPLGASGVAVVSAGVVAIWTPTSGEAPSPLSGAPSGVTGPIAADAEGRIAVFHPPSGAVRLFRPE